MIWTKRSGNLLHQLWRTKLNLQIIKGENSSGRWSMGLISTICIITLENEMHEMPERYTVETAYVMETWKLPLDMFEIRPRHHE